MSLYSYLKGKKESKAEMILSRIKQSARNLSYSRANAVRDSLINYAEGNGITVDSSQFGVVGHGVIKPNTAGAAYDASGDIALSSAPRSREEWEATRRVVFRLVQIEAESDVSLNLSFNGLNYGHQKKSFQRPVFRRHSLYHALYLSE